MTEIVDLQTVRNEIETRGLKVKHLAKVIGVSPGTLSSFLTGKRGLGLAAKKSLYRELNLKFESLTQKAS